MFLMLIDYRIKTNLDNLDQDHVDAYIIIKISIVNQNFNHLTSD